MGEKWVFRGSAALRSCKRIQESGWLFAELCPRPMSTKVPDEPAPIYLRKGFNDIPQVHSLLPAYRDATRDRPARIPDTVTDTDPVPESNPEADGGPPTAVAISRSGSTARLLLAFQISPALLLFAFQILGPLVAAVDAVALVRLDALEFRLAGPAAVGATGAGAHRGAYYWSFGKAATLGNED